MISRGYTLEGAKEQEETQAEGVLDTMKGEHQPLDPHMKLDWTLRKDKRNCLLRNKIEGVEQ